MDDCATKILVIKRLPREDKLMLRFLIRRSMDHAPGRYFKSGQTVATTVASPSDSAVELHEFSDTSQLAMSAGMYIAARSPSTSTTHAVLDCLKMRIALLKRLKRSRSRLEFTAAPLLSALVKAIHLWTDSQVTLMR